METTIPVWITLLLVGIASAPSIALCVFLAVQNQRLVSKLMAKSLAEYSSYEGKGIPAKKEPTKPELRDGMTIGPVVA